MSHLFALFEKAKPFHYWNERNSFICNGLCWFAGIILPTCYGYLETFKIPNSWFYGLTLAGMSITCLFSSPLAGALYDWTHHAKSLVLVLNLFGIGGMRTT